MIPVNVIKIVVHENISRNISLHSKEYNYNHACALLSHNILKNYRLFFKNILN